MKRSLAALSVISLGLAWGEPRSEITKWQDGKEACISLTFDDSSINQFRIDMPLLNERHIPGTFFIETGLIEGSKNHPTFVGRPIMDILRESTKIPTSKENWLERASMLNYLRMVQQVPAINDFSAQRLGRAIGAIEVAVSHSLDPHLYDLPLTARTTIPADWRLAWLRQGDDVRWLPVHREGGEPFMMYRIAPNGKTAVIEKAVN